MEKPYRSLFIALFFLFGIFAKADAQTVAITSPAAGSNYNVGDVISVTATATAPSLGTVNKMVITLGTLTPVTDVTSPYTASLNTSTLAAGTYTLTATNYYTTAVGSQGTTSATISVVIASASATSYGNYAFSKVLTLKSSTLGITTSLSNFPALIYVQDNSLKIGNACADKVQNPNGTNYDFAFTLPGSSTELNYQVEKYDQTAGSLLVWVNIPTLSYSTNTTINFYFGSKAPTVTHNAAFFGNTWTSDYLAVYHLNEGSATVAIVDGTNNGRNATQTNTTPVTGEVNGGYQFNGTTSQIITTSTSNNITGSFTLSAWVNPTSFTGHTDQKIITNQYSYTAGGYKFGLYGASATTVYDEVETRSATGAASLNRSASGGTPLTSGVWHYLQGVYNASNNTFYTYVDGVLDRSMTGAVASGNGNVIYLGSDFNAGNWLYGILDEARISNVAKSSDWIKAEYANQSNPTTFTTGGTVAINQTYAATIPGALTYTYKGVTTTYNDPNNWDNTTTGVTNQAPAFDGTASLIIPTGKNLTLGANASVFGITLSGTGTLTLNGYNLNVACNVYNQGTGKIDWNNNNASKITWNGSGTAQSYNGTTAGAYAHVGTMEVNNSAGGTVTVNSDTLDIYRELKITKGNLAVASGGIMVLKSYAAQTAEVPAIPSPYSITGTVYAERFLTGGTGYRGYRLLSSPVSTAAGSGIYSINYLINTCYLTGTTGIPGGFDKAGNPTIYFFRENMAPAYTTFLNSSFRGVNNITSASSLYQFDGDAGSFSIPLGNGFLFFFKGDRAAANLATETTTTYVPVAATLKASGVLNQGTITVADWYTPTSQYLGFTNTTGNASVKGFNLVGNPYPSAIDWDLFSSTSSAAAIYGPGLNGYIYCLDQVSKNYGAYLVGSGGTGTNNATHIIPSGLGFFVRATATSPQLVFTEAAKTAAQVSGNQLLMGKPVAATVNRFLMLKLNKDSMNYDETMIRFNDTASNKFVQTEDAPYLQGLGAVSLSSFSSDSVAMAVNQMKLPKQTSLSIPLKITAKTSGVYKMQMVSASQIPQVYDLWLMDAYKHDSVDMKHNNTYLFDINQTDSTTFGSGRFKLVIRENPAYAYRLLNFTADKQPSSAQIVWQTENEQNYTNFTVERSNDNGATYNVIGSVASSDLGKYSLIDHNPLTGTNLYRLKQEDMNSAVTYSNVVPVVFGTPGKDIMNIYPNPASNVINLSVLQTSTSNSTYHIMITNSVGLNVLSSISSQRDWQGNINSLPPGSYILTVVDNKDKSLVGRAKFVKESR